MKKIILLIFILSQALVNFGQLKSLNRVMDDTDPNKDPNWEWWVDNTQILYYKTESQPGSINTVSAKLPWFTNEGPASILNTHDPATKDMYPCDGWVLLYRDFGSRKFKKLMQHI